MKPTNHTGVEVKSAIEGERIAMSVDQSAMAHIMRIMTDLYSDTEAAPLREYSTNAWDAHVMAGTTQPIEVQTPNALSPFLRIKDYGIGLTVDDIHDIYVKYGASTKRSSDDFNGMLGLGCKSALTYTSQFTLTSVKDGTKVQCSVSRDEDGGGSLTIVDTSTTDEPNGTEVTIPARRGNSLEAKAEEFFSYWPAGTVMLNGEQPQRFDERNDVLKVTDSLYIVKGWSEAKIVMGNVAYPAPNLTVGLPQNYSTKAALLAFVPIGRVSFTPAREGLMDDRTTKAAIEQLKADFNAGITTAMQTEIDASATALDAVKVVIRWNAIVPQRGQVTSLLYRGRPMPTSFAPGYKPGREHVMLHADASDRYGKGKAYPREAHDLSMWPWTLWVENFIPQNFSAPIKDKIRKWADQQKLSMGTHDTIRHIICVPDGKAPDSEFVDQRLVVDYQTIRAIQLVERDASGKVTSFGRIPGSYDVWVDGHYRHGIPGSQIDRTKPIFWVHGNRSRGYIYSKLLNQFHKHCYVVCLGANRVEKWKRDVPESKSVLLGVQEAHKAWSSKLTHDQRVAMTMASQHATHDLVEMKKDAGVIKDPDLLDAIRIAQIDVALQLDAQRTFRGVLDTGSMNVKWTNPLVKYPLWTMHDYRAHRKHVISYLNHAYDDAQAA